MPRAIVFFLILVALPLPALQAQPERNELGRRLKLLELEWEKQTNAEDRKRALVGLPKVTQQFFSFQFGEAGRTLDTARFALMSKDPPAEATRWAEPLYITPASRLIPADQAELGVTINQFYKPDATRPEKVTLVLQWPGEKPVELPWEKFPMKVTVPLPKIQETASDQTLTFQVQVDGKVVTTQTVVVSRISGLDERLKKLKDFKAPEKATIETATLQERVELFKQLAAGQTLETDFPAAKLLLDAEAIAAKPEVAIFTPERVGQSWFSVPTGKGKTTACRILVPKGLDPKKPVPLVVALHGAGGSENLFFEGYGAGEMVKQCEKRGWLLIATRTGGAFGLGGSAPPVGDIVDVLKERYPIDTTKVFVVGHSMGAAQTIDTAQAYPGKFAGVAALGGGGRVRKGEAFGKLPVFVGVGSKDFALGGAKSLHKALVDAGATTATYKEYPDIEHMVIVREALPDVFVLFDKLSKPVK